jgi:hypothetical protein
MQRVEIGLAVLSCPNRLPVHDDGADPKGSQGHDCPRILGGPIVASTDVQPDPVAVPPSNEPVSVVLDFVGHADPLGAFWEGQGRQGGKALGEPGFSLHGLA